MATLVRMQPRVTVRNRVDVMLAATRMRLINITRYPGQLITDLIIPLVLAAMPILLGQASAGDQAGAIFEANTGTSNYIGYMIIGSSVMTIVSYAFWHVAYWLRFEMETGTIEALYLAPTDRIWVLAGVSLYSMIRSLFSAIVAYFLGSLIFGSNPFQGDLLIAFMFVVFGMLPLYGVTLIFGAVILKLKQANSIINLMQWVVNFLMGIFFPIAVLPPLARFAALAFPPTWMTNGVRSAMLGVGYFFGEWYYDMAVLWVFMLIAPMVGATIFRRVETSVRRNEGVGKF